MAYIHNWIKVKLNIKYEDFLKLEGEIKFNMNVSFVYQEPGRQSRWVYAQVHCTGLFVSPSGISDHCRTVAGMVTPKGSMSTEGDNSKFLSYLTGTRYVDFWGLLTNVSRTRLTVSADGPGRPLRFAAHRQPLCWNFMYDSRIVLSVGGSVRYMVRNLGCTVTIDSVLANSKTQNAFLFTMHAIFRHDNPLVVEPASTPRPLVQKKLWEILYLLICSFLPCLSWLLRRRVRKFRRDLWITLYQPNTQKVPGLI